MVLILVLLVLISSGLGWYVFQSNQVIKQQATPQIVTTPLPEVKLDGKNLPEVKTKSDVSYLYITSPEEMPFSVRWPDGRYLDKDSKLAGASLDLMGPIGSDTGPTDTSMGSVWELDHRHPMSGTYTIVFSPTKSGTYTPSVYVAGASGGDADLEKTLTVEAGIRVTLILEYDRDKVRNSKLIGSN